MKGEEKKGARGAPKFLKSLSSRLTTEAMLRKTQLDSLPQGVQKKATCKKKRNRAGQNLLEGSEKK